MKEMTFHHAPFTGAFYCECECGWKCNYWEDESDLIHDCEGDDK